MSNEPDVRPNGAAIRAFRRKDHRTRADVARFAGITPQSLTNIENGHRSTKRAVVTKIAQILDVPLAAITHKDACARAGGGERTGIERCADRAHERHPAAALEG